jgi:hypothetical protein
MPASTADAPVQSAQRADQGGSSPALKGAACTSETQSPPDLGSALDMLEHAIAELELRRPIIEDAQLARLTRLRLRLRRLAGKPEEHHVGSGACSAPLAHDRSDPSGGAARDLAEAQATDLGIPAGLASRLPKDMLDDLRRVPRKQKSLAEERVEYEEQMRLEKFDPLANDPGEQALRRKREQYVAPGSEPAPMGSAKPHERLRKPPIQNLANRKPPSWQDAYNARYEYTMEQIRLGLAPEGIMRTLGPGPWDHDPSFWRDPHDRDVVLDHELDEDIVFN